MRERGERQVDYTSLIREILTEKSESICELLVAVVAESRNVSQSHPVSFC